MGFLVPEEYRMQLQQIALENSIVRERATVIPMNTDSLKIPYVNDTSHASSVFGGVVAYWTAEAEAKTATKPTFGQMELTPHKLAGLTYSSDELLADSAVALEPLIRKQFGAAWGYFEDDAFLTGTGAGQPLGIQNCNATINNLRNTANRVMIEDLAEMYMRLLPTSHSSAYWVINPTVIPELIELNPSSYREQSLYANPSNSGKPSSYRHGNPEPSPGYWEGVETGRWASLMDEGTVQTTNTVH